MRPQTQVVAQQGPRAADTDDVPQQVAVWKCSKDLNEQVVGDAIHLCRWRAAVVVIELTKLSQARFAAAVSKL